MSILILSIVVVWSRPFLFITDVHFFFLFPQCHSFEEFQVIYQNKIVISVQVKVQFVRLVVNLYYLSLHP